MQKKGRQKLNFLSEKKNIELRKYLFYIHNTHLKFIQYHSQKKY